MGRGEDGSRRHAGFLGNSRVRRRLYDKNQSSRAESVNGGLRFGVRRQSRRAGSGLIFTPPSPGAQLSQTEMGGESRDFAGSTFASKN